MSDRDSAKKNRIPVRIDFEMIRRMEATQSSLRSMRTLLLLTVLTSAASLRADPTLEETLKWMDSKLSNHEFVTGTLTQVRFKYSDVKVTDCALSFSFKTEGGTVPNVTQFQSSRFARIPLGKLDLRSFATETPAAQTGKIVFRSMGKEITVRNNDSGELATFTDSYDLILESRPLADRFARAMMHAAQLCGAQAEPF